VIGEIAAFHGKRQIRLTAPLRVLPDESVQPERFLPRIAVPTGFEHTARGSLIGHVVLGAFMLQERLATVPPNEISLSQRLELQHMLLSHHGSLEFGSPVQPMTPEAEILHWADETSAKTNDMAESIAEDEHFGGGEVSDRRPWRVGRRIWRRPHGWE